MSDPRGCNFPLGLVGNPWAIWPAFTLDLRKLGAICVERMNELAVVLQQRGRGDARLLATRGSRRV